MGYENCKIDILSNKVTISYYCHQIQHRIFFHFVNFGENLRGNIFYAKINELLPVSLSLGEIKDGSVFQVNNCSDLPVLHLVHSICSYIA